MDERIQKYEDKMKKTLSGFETELTTIRAGRANPHILDKLTVDYYGTALSDGKIDIGANEAITKETAARKEIAAYIEAQNEVISKLAGLSADEISNYQGQVAMSQMR